MVNPSDIIKSMGELGDQYRVMVQRDGGIDLGDWLPTLRSYVRQVFGGEVVMFMSDTGVGKSACLGNLAHKIRPADVLMFHMELPGTLVFERFAARAHATKAWDIEKLYRNGSEVRTGPMDHVWVCDKPRRSLEDMQEAITEIAPQVMGNKPDCVMVDYIGLMAAKGAKSRYERISMVAEDMKTLAKECDVAVFAACQTHRTENTGNTPTLHDARDSGAIEEASDVLIGVGRDEDQGEKMYVRILKNRKGRLGNEIECNFDGETMTIGERILEHGEPPGWVRE